MNKVFTKYFIDFVRPYIILITQIVIFVNYKFVRFFFTKLTVKTEYALKPKNMFIYLKMIGRVVCSITTVFR